MSVSWVRELNRYDWDEDNEGNETARIEFEIFVDDYTTSIGTILSHGDVPARRAAHPENSNALPKKKNPSNPTTKVLAFGCFFIALLL